MFVVLAVAFLVVPIVEIYVMLQVSGAIGVPETILLLIVISVVGAWLAKMAGIGVLNRLQRTVRAGKVPSAELVDGALVLFAGRVDDHAGVPLRLPGHPAAPAPVPCGRPRGRAAPHPPRGGLFQVITTVPAGGGRTGAGDPVWDVESWEDPNPDPPERPSLER